METRRAYYAIHKVKDQRLQGRCATLHQFCCKKSLQADRDVMPAMRADMLTKQRNW